MQFIFIVGCQRSGTTLAGQILGAHPHAFLVDEDEGLYDSLELWRSGNTRLYDALTVCFTKAAGKYVDARRQAGGQPDSDNGISHIVVKAPNATMFLADFLRRHDEEPLHFVFPVRDGRDVVASMARLAHIHMTDHQVERLQKFGKSLDLAPDQLAKLVADETADIQKRALIWELKTSLVHAYTKPPLNSLWFRYEDLVRDYEKWQRTLLTHVGLDPERAPDDASRVYRGTGPGWTFRNRPVDDQSVGRWTNRLSAEEASQVWKIIAPTMLELGYDKTTKPLPHQDKTVDAEVLAAPIIATGRGGSGTRLLSLMLNELGVFLGNRMNNSQDSIEWADLIYEIALGRLQGRSLPGWPQELKDRATSVLKRSNADPGLWGWKLPETMFMLEDCLQAFPQARLIHLVRHPVDTSLRRTHVTSRRQHAIGNNVLAKSYSYLGWKPTDVHTDPEYRLNMASWLYQVEQASSFGRSLAAERYLEVRYEDICQAPQEVSNQLADFLGVQRIRTAVATELDGGRRSNWSWPDSRADEVWRICGKTAARFGYTPPEHTAAYRQSTSFVHDLPVQDTGPVLFVVGGALGHVGRSLMVAEEMASRGHKVHFAGRDPYGFIKTIIGQRFSYDSWPDLSFDPQGFSLRLEHVVSSLRPSCIVLDINPLPLLATWKRNHIPTVFLANVFLTRLGQRGTLQDAAFEKYNSGWNTMRDKRGLPPLNCGRELYEATRVLLCDPPGLWDGETKLPPHYEWIGPCSWQPSEMALPESLQEAGNLCFISFGSTGAHEFPTAALEYIQARLRPQAVIALHASAEVSWPGVEGFERLPASSVLKRSMVALTHGGTGSTYQALQQGVPVMIWPKHLNHKRLGEILQERGLGVLLDGKRWQHDIDRFVDQWKLLRDQVRAEAERPWMQDGPARAATVIESLMGTTVAPGESNSYSLPAAPAREQTLEEVLSRETALEEIKAREQALYRKLHESEHKRRLVLRELQSVYASYSWRITAPIRALLEHLRKIRIRKLNRDLS